MSKSKNIIAAKRIAIAVATVCASLSAPAFAAADNKALLDLMLKKGVITQKDYDEFVDATRDAEENKAFKEQRTDQDVTKAVKFIQKREKDGNVKENGFGLVSANGEHSVNLTGRVHFDSRVINHDFGTFADRDTQSIGDNFEIRRARIGLNGFVFKDIAYEIVTNAVGSSANLIDTAWMNYGFNKSVQFRFGRFKQPFSLEELTSSNNIDFMERSYVNQLVPTKKLGAMIHGEPIENMTYALSLYQNNFNEVTNQDNNGRELAGRLTYNFGKSLGSDSVMHVGLGGTTGKNQTALTSSSNTASAASATTRATFVGFRSENRGLANIFRAQLGGPALGTPAYGGTADEPMTVKKDLGGLEFAYAMGPLKVQSEYANAKYDSSTSVASGSGTVKAYYAEIMYNITGEKWSDAYRSGAFSGLKPSANYTAGGGTGAWQVGLRWSAFDASDVSVTGTSVRTQNSVKGNTLTLGLNWLINPNARVMLNYAMTKFDTPVTPLDVAGASASDKEQVISVRTQLNF
jgi:phosphate-selective porin OprO/OprP